MKNVNRMIQIELEKLRADEARITGLEPYKILQNQTIDLLSRLQPQTNIELLTIKGIGPAKAKKYGSRILRIIKEAIEGGAKEDGIQDSSSPTPKEPKVYSVGEFLDVLNRALSVKQVTVRGEVFGRVDRRGSALYFTLKDTAEEAQLSCFARTYIEESAGVLLEEGMEITLAGYPSVYKPSGRFSLQVSDMTLSGEGLLKKAYEKLKQDLEKEGLFAEERKQKVAYCIKRVGLITARGSDAERDFITHLAPFGISVERFDVRVEGVRAVDEICAAIAWFNKNRNDCEVLVLTRGGGSLESLQAFNNERVARAIAASKIPVIAGIGHERDVSIADLVADVRVSTPTHAGKFLSEPWREAVQKLTSNRELLESHVSLLFTTIRRILNDLLSEGSRALERVFVRNIHLLERNRGNLLHYLRSIFTHFREISGEFGSHIGKIETLLLRHSAELLNEKKLLLRNVSEARNRTVRELASLAGTLQAHNPELRLKQGYSIALASDGKVIKSADGLLKGEKIRTKFADGEVTSEVEEVRKT